MNLYSFQLTWINGLHSADRPVVASGSGRSVVGSILLTNVADTLDSFLAVQYLKNIS